MTSQFMPIAFISSLEFLTCISNRPLDSNKQVKLNMPKTKVLVSLLKDCPAPVFPHSANGNSIFPDVQSKKGGVLLDFSLSFKIAHNQPNKYHCNIFKIYLESHCFSHPSSPMPLDQTTSHHLLTRISYSSLK